MTLGKCRRVFVIEDNVDAADTLGEILRFEGHDVTVLYDAVDLVRTGQRELPNIVLCDIGLPILCGYEVARALRRQVSWDATWLVALTGYAHSEERQRAFDAGFDRYLVKPIDCMALDALFSELAPHRTGARGP